MLPPGLEKIYKKNYFLLDKSYKSAIIKETSKILIFSDKKGGFMHENQWWFEDEFTTRNADSSEDDLFTDRGHIKHTILPKSSLKQRKNQLKVQYGISLDHYDGKFAEQKGCCAICGAHQRSLKIYLCVDHNHDTGQERGLLCNICNLRLGFVENDMKYSWDFKEQAIKYLEQYK